MDQRELLSRSLQSSIDTISLDSQWAIEVFICVQLTIHPHSNLFIILADTNAQIPGWS